MSTVDALQLESRCLSSEFLSQGRRNAARWCRSGGSPDGGGRGVRICRRYRGRVYHPIAAKETPNEDVAALWPTSPGRGVLAVADGLGGHAGGEAGLALAIETIQTTSKTLLPGRECPG